MKLLIVCAGNTCRSPMAGGLLKKIASERGIKLEIHTAGACTPPKPTCGREGGCRYAGVGNQHCG